eukprot:TRINITY_DN6473_c0_g1_i4.p1 TRINITY_DN6473_c0_g1~~TRINITY_DN6473_c0_g1_i4.p1  ORF type:complete len:133 (-),score=28.35 TRINITY_DN6473_c0_g1_i4:385-783(-)
MIFCCRYVVYISTLCLDLAQGKEALNATLNSLFVLSSGRNEPDTESGVPEKSNEASRPNLLWCTLFSQDLKDSNNLATDIKQSCVPDETLDYRRLVNHTNMVFEQFFSAKDLFPELTTNKESTEEADATQDQ